MSTQADHGPELVPRPEQTSDALRAALAIVAPGTPPGVAEDEGRGLRQGRGVAVAQPGTKLVTGLGAGHRDRPSPRSLRPPRPRTEKPGTRGRGDRTRGPSRADRGPGRGHEGSQRLSWTREYAFGAEQAARTAPPAFLAEVEHRAAELVRAAEHAEGPVSREPPPGRAAAGPRAVQRSEAPGTGVTPVRGQGLWCLPQSSFRAASFRLSRRA